MLSALPSSPATAPVLLREHYRAGKNALLASLAGSGASTRGIHSLLHKLARHTDSALRQLWLRADFPAGCALVAVGGFGRGELFPHSDVDVLLLLPHDARVDHDAALKAKIENFIGSCWDSGLEISSSVRTVADCVEEAVKDVTVQTSLLEARLVSGSKEIFSTLMRQLDSVHDPQAFFVAKTLELRQRHNKFENTPYALEPNCKESPGGLRDLQVILWVAHAAGLGKSWDDLAQSGLATAFEVRQIKTNEALLCLIRARLHLIAGRREDRLVFDLQTAVAESFGYGGDTFRRRAAPWRNSPPGGQEEHAGAERGGLVRASEVLM
ncbi:MAG: nucleotidyltransferase domain-containing protein, partial [Burkholderiales bacterium]|nr:nucleotidyltransferase domain-containing protein [Burkholderiales bacterium]